VRIVHAERKQARKILYLFLSVSISVSLYFSLSLSLSLSCGGFLFCRLMEAVQKNEMIGEEVSRFSGFQVFEAGVA
jgi:hypothetical protein